MIQYLQTLIDDQHTNQKVVDVTARSAQLRAELVVVAFVLCSMAKLFHNLKKKTPIIYTILRHTDTQTRTHRDHSGAAAVAAVSPKP